MLDMANSRLWRVKRQITHLVDNGSEERRWRIRQGSGKIDTLSHDILKLYRKKERKGESHHPVFDLFVVSLDLLMRPWRDDHEPSFIVRPN